MKQHWFTRCVAAGAVAVAMVAVGAGAVGATVKSHGTKTATLYVAPKAGRAKQSGPCKTARYSSINAAIKAAAAGDTVRACPGTYTGSASITVPGPGGAKLTITSGALITKAISLVGMRGAIIDAKGLVNGVTILGPGAAGTVVNGITATGAIGEGILAALTGHVTIENNTVEHNDNGTAKSAWLECQAKGVVPNDCGEGVHLLTVSGSKVLNNTVEFNSGGVLLTDEFGPTSHNLVSGNLVEDNESDCGVTVVGHNPAAVNSKNVPQPTKGGVFDNTISANMIISNGTIGFGGGVILAGIASYNNTVIGNEIVGNGLSGVTIHEHAGALLGAPGVDVSGNAIIGNWIGTNNVTGDFGDPLTTGVFVERDSPKLATVTVTIKNNTIAWDHFGIFDNAGSGLTASGNTFLHVTVKVMH